MKIKGIIILCFVCLVFLLSSCGSVPNPLGGKVTTTLYPIRQNGKNGYINRRGEIVIQPQFAFTLPFSEGLAPACLTSSPSGGNCGYIDETGKFIINPQFEFVARFSEGLAAVSAGGKTGFIDKTGKFVINPQFEMGHEGFVSTFSDGLALVGVGGNLGFIDQTGKFVINPQFEKKGCLPFFEGLAAVKIGEKWGFIDKEGKISINPQFDEAQPFVKGLAAVKLGSQYGYIDKTGKIIINPQFDFAGPFSDEGLAIVALKDKEGFIDKTGKYLVNPQFRRRGSISDWIEAFMITSDLGRLSFSEGLTPVQVGDNEKASIGFADKTGKIIINPQFGSALPFYGGIAFVTLGIGPDSDMAWIDKEGKIVWRETRELPKTAANSVANAVNAAANAVNTAAEAANRAANAANTASQSSSTKEYEGTLNNNYQITMTLTRSGDSLSGYVVPKAGGSSIPVRGTINSSGEFNLNEYDDKDNWTGTYKGRISGNTIEGNWTKPDGSAQRPLYLTEK